MAERVPEAKRLQAPKDGAVLVTAMPDVTEKEIVDDRANITLLLHSTYAQLNEDMAEFQKHWKENPTMAFIDSACEGVGQGSATWLSDQAELFEKATWVEIGNKIENFAGASIDRLATYSKRQYNDLEREINKHVKNPEATLYNWAWWQTTIEKHVTEHVQEQAKRIGAIEHSLKEAAHSVVSAAETARKIHQHRAAILNLPNLISNGDPKAVQAFVENELMDIDSKLARSIRNDPNFAIVLELIADHDSALTYVAYIGLMMEAIPPNFYAYVAGKGAAYVMIEVIMLVVTALLSAGAATAGRIAVLAARFAASGAKIVTNGKKLRRAKVAVDTFIAMLKHLSRAVDELHMLGAKLVKARSKGLEVRGTTRTNLVAKKESVRRDKRCRACGKTTHNSPRVYLGEVIYK